MDCEKVGALLQSLRKEQNLTQREVAARVHVSDKTVSKWERGRGCPEVSLLPLLSSCFGVNIEKILSGDLGITDRNGGNMKKTKFYICPVCGNIITGSGSGEMTCCGRVLKAEEPQKPDEEHAVTLDASADETYLVFSHEMEKSHFLAFVAQVTADRLEMVRLYPEGASETRLARLRGGTLYWYCNRDGLFSQRL